MTERPTLGIQKARDTFRTVVDDALVKRVITVVERHGQPVAAVVPYEWLLRADAALKKEAAAKAAHDDDSSSSR